MRLALLAAVAAAAATFGFVPSTAQAAQFATAVAGASVNSPGVDYHDPAAALGSPSPIVGQSIGFAEINSPFSPAFEGNQLYTIAAGNFLTLDFGAPVSVHSGPEIGVFSNVGLTDSNYPSAVINGKAATFSAPGTAIISVSADNVTFHTLNGGQPVTLDIPVNYYANAATPYDLTAPANPVLADFSKPFTGSLSSFDNTNWAGVLTALNGSAGGTWLDADASGLSTFRYVRFDVPSDGTALSLDAVSLAAVPEPASIAIIALAGSALAVRPRRRTVTVR